VTLAASNWLARLQVSGEHIKVNQEGRQIILQTEEPITHRVAVPAHKILRVGTLNAILRTVARHKGVEKQEILDSLSQRGRI
jgi:hypothetical protein